MAKDEFLEMEMVNIFTALDGGGMESSEGFVVQAEENKVIVRSGSQQLLTFMYSAPDDMWLRVVPDGGSVACTRLEKIKPVERTVMPSADKYAQVLDNYAWLNTRKDSLRKFFARG